MINPQNSESLQYIEAGLAKFCRTYAEKGITSVAFPRLGCGNGGLNWSDVMPIMEKHLQDLPIDIFIYLGTGSDTLFGHRIQEKTVDWHRQNARDMSFQSLEDDIQCHCSVDPYHFVSGKTEWNVLWEEDGLVFQKHGKKAESVQINEDNFFEIWSDLRCNGLALKAKENSAHRLVLDLLLALGYVSEVKVIDGKTGGKTNGYQINAGAGRVYDLKGRADEQ